MTTWRIAMPIVLAAAVLCLPIAAAATTGTDAQGSGGTAGSPQATTVSNTDESTDSAGVSTSGGNTTITGTAHKPTCDCEDMSTCTPDQKQQLMNSCNRTCGTISWTDETGSSHACVKTGGGCTGGGGGASCSATDLKTVASRLNAGLPVTLNEDGKFYSNVSIGSASGGGLSLEKIFGDDAPAAPASESGVTDPGLLTPTPESEISPPNLAGVTGSKDPAQAPITTAPTAASTPGFLVDSSSYMADMGDAPLSGGNAFVPQDRSPVQTSSFTGFFPTLPVSGSSPEQAYLSSGGLLSSHASANAGTFSLYARDYGALYGGTGNSENVASLVTAQTAYENPSYDSTCSGVGACGIGQYIPSTWNADYGKMLSATQNLAANGTPSEQQAANELLTHIGSLSGTDLRSDPQTVAAVMAYHDAGLYPSFTQTAQNLNANYGTNLSVSDVAQIEHFGTGYYNTLKNSPTTPITSVQSSFLAQNPAVARYCSSPCTMIQAAQAVGAGYSGRPISVANNLIGSTDSFVLPGKGSSAGQAFQVASNESSAPFPATYSGPPRGNPLDDVFAYLGQNAQMGDTGVVTTGNGALVAINQALGNPIQTVTESVAQKVQDGLSQVGAWALGGYTGAGNAGSSVPDGGPAAGGTAVAAGPAPAEGTSVSAAPAGEDANPIVTVTAGTPSVADGLRAIGTWAVDANESGTISADMSAIGTAGQGSLAGTDLSAYAQTHGLTSMGQVVNGDFNALGMTGDGSAEEGLRAIGSWAVPQGSGSAMIGGALDSEGGAGSEYAPTLTTAPGTGEYVVGTSPDVPTDFDTSGVSQASGLATGQPGIALPVGPSGAAIPAGGEGSADGADMPGIIGGTPLPPSGSAMIQPGNITVVKGSIFGTIGTIAHAATANISNYFQSLANAQKGVGTGGDTAEAVHDGLMNVGTWAVPGAPSEAPDASPSGTAPASGMDDLFTALGGTDAAGVTPTLMETTQTIPGTVLAPSRSTVAQSQEYQQGMTDLLNGSAVRFGSLSPGDQKKLIGYIPQITAIAGDSSLTEAQKKAQITTVLMSDPGGKYAGHDAGFAIEVSTILPESFKETGDLSKLGLGTADQAMTKISSVYTNAAQALTTTAPSTQTTSYQVTPGTAVSQALGETPMETDIGIDQAMTPSGAAVGAPAVPANPAAGGSSAGTGASAPAGAGASAGTGASAPSSASPLGGILDLIGRSGSSISNALSGLLSGLFGGGSSQGGSSQGGAPQGSASRPAFTCDPAAVVSSAEATVTIAWQCDSGSSSARGTGFGQGTLAPAGRATVMIGTTTDEWLSYGVGCSDGTSNSCQVRVLHPLVTLVAFPEAVARGASAQIGWSGADVVACALYDADGTLRAHGGANGSYATVPLSRSVVFRMACRSSLGTIIVASTTIPVIGDASAPLDTPLPAAVAIPDAQ
ncbi:MAG TPA: hypothetical protein VFL98_03670 [Candidatus Paceibacterota bacterium]|nr:hypothetical protein [Candidatus Paceibacterota bacterium]